jgi:alpha-beta hydrolase superfamily lysophospholipase
MTDASRFSLVNPDTYAEVALKTGALVRAWPLKEAGQPLAGPLGAVGAATLVIVHGRGEHAGRYARLAADLAPSGIGCVAVDLRGFGLTVAKGRKPGAVRRFEEYLDDVEGAVAQLATPFVILGHSVGGLVVVRLAEERAARLPRSLRGIVLSSPFFAMPRPLSLAKRAIVGVISAIAPDKALPTKGDPLTRDEACWEAYRKDPLTVKAPTARWLTETLKHQKLAFADAKRLAVPTLVLQGGDDSSTDPNASQRFAELVNADYKEYAGCYHEVLNEPEEDRARVIADLRAWVLSRASSPPRPA